MWYKTEKIPAGDINFFLDMIPYISRPEPDPLKPRKMPAGIKVVPAGIYTDLRFALQESVST